MPRSRSRSGPKTGLIETFPNSAQFYVLQLEPEVFAACVVPAHKRKVQLCMEGRSSEWVHDICTSCPMYKDNTKWEEEIQENSLIHLDSEELRSAVGQEFSQPGNPHCPGAMHLRFFGGYSACKAQKSFPDTQECLAQIPDTLWTRNADGVITVHAVDLKREDGLWVKPLGFPNVYDNAHICWGRNPAPKNLRDAFNLFFSAPFNRDLLRNMQFSLKHTLEHYDPFKDHLPWFNFKERVFGRSYVTRNTDAEAVVVFDHPETLNCVPAPYRTGGKVVGWVKGTQSGEYLINCKGYIIRRKTLTNKGKTLPMGLAADLL